MLARLRTSSASAVVAAVVLIGVACLPTGASSAPAPKVVVKNTHDSGPGSLRNAVTKAVEGETIEVPAGHYRLRSGDLSADVSLKIAGAGARRTLIDGTGASRIIEDTSATSTLNLSNLTVENGNSHLDSGGGIETEGALTLVRVAVVGNRAGDNHEPEVGGGAEVFGKLVVRSSLIAHNRANTGGGAYTDSTLDIINSTVADNQAGSATPGDNGVSGAIETDDRPATVVNSTIAFNRCFNGPACGGAFFNGDFTFTNSIIAENLGFLDNGHSPGSKGNPASQTNCDGPDLARYMTAGYNLGGTVDCGLTNPSDQQNVNPRLGKLKNNGGPTDTLAPGSGSPAIDRIPVAKCPTLAQRGRHRPDRHERRCDVGAYEHQDQ
jgi:hypothetical protein